MYYNLLLSADHSKGHPRKARPN